MKEKQGPDRYYIMNIDRFEISIVVSNSWWIWIKLLSREYISKERNISSEIVTRYFEYCSWLEMSVSDEGLSIFIKILLFAII